MMSLTPTAGALIAIVALWFYPLGEDTVTQMTADLKLRREAEPQPT